jgi:L-asparaginase
MAPEGRLPRVCLIYTGGTIGMVREGDVLKPPSSPEHFTNLAPEIRDLARIEFVPILNKDSTNMNPLDWTLMATTVHRALDQTDDTWGQDKDPFVGVVVVHGTDTMHFSASAVAFALGPNLNAPVVFTGAQTDASVLHGDARINLIRAVRVACEDIAAVVISFGDFIFLGCRTQKRDERRFNAFESPAYYPIGDITERILLHPNAPRRVPNEEAEPVELRANFEANVLQVSLIPGLRPTLLEPVLEIGDFDGVILQSFGAGNVPDQGDYSFQPFITRAVERNIPVIVASQFPANSTMDTHYEPGRNAMEAGAVPTGNMTNAAATAKFYWVLARVNDRIARGELLASQKADMVADEMASSLVNEMDLTPRLALEPLPEH